MQFVILNCLSGYLIYLFQLDPFLGSGTTALASKLLGLNYIGFEIDEIAFKSAQSRLQQKTLDLELFGVEHI